MLQIIEELEKAEVGELRLNEPMARYTTWKIGGPADLLIVPSGKPQLIKTIQILQQNGHSWTTIGRGSNLLISDKGIRGPVIKLGKGLEQLRFEDDLVYVGAAYSFVRLSVLASLEGLSGLEFAGGIPGTVGGAVYMNAGAHGSDMSRILQKAEVLLESGELVHWDHADFEFDYRYSKLQTVRGVVVEAVLKLAKGDQKQITAKMRSLRDYRLKTQPLKEAVAGSVFRNPLPHFAAKLIEEAGLKGYRIGGAEVSTQHANFIVNKEQATARDVLQLIEHIQQEIAEKYQIDLIPEVLVAGER